MLFHIGFWKIWDWNTELEKLSFTNKWIMPILNVQIIYYFIFTAVICFAFHKELFTTNLGKCFLMSTAGFWFIRAIQQFVFWELGAVSTIIGVLFFYWDQFCFLFRQYVNKRQVLLNNVNPHPNPSIVIFIVE